MAKTERHAGAYHNDDRAIPPAHILRRQPAFDATQHASRSYAATPPSAPPTHGELMSTLMRPKVVSGGDMFTLRAQRLRSAATRRLRRAIVPVKTLSRHAECSGV